MNRCFFLVLALLLTLTLQAQPIAPGQLTLIAHQESVLKFQQELNKEFSTTATSPLAPKERRQFKTLPFYPISYNYYLEATLLRDSTSLLFAMETSTSRRPLYRKYGTLRFVLKGQPLQLTVYQSLDLLKREGFADYLFVPFTDPTNGHDTYGGRYLDLRIPPADRTTMSLDFNQAYNPSCAYNHAYSCPIPPAENRLTVPVTAGVRTE
jgi:uncharacterized protein (DUF1684 family)